MTPPAGSRKPSDGLKRSGHGPTKRRLKVERLEQDRREALALVEQSAALCLGRISASGVIRSLARHRGHVLLGPFCQALQA